MKTKLYFTKLQEKYVSYMQGEYILQAVHTSCFGTECIPLTQA
jgi:hypothetical protein